MRGLAIKSSTTGDLIKLRRIAPGLYETLDGEWQIERGGNDRQAMPSGFMEAARAVLADVVINPDRYTHT